MGVGFSNVKNLRQILIEQSFHNCLVLTREDAVQVGSTLCHVLDVTSFLLSGK